MEQPTDWAVKAKHLLLVIFKHTRKVALIFIFIVLFDLPPVI